MAYVAVTKLKHLLIYCHKVLPLVYEDSLSYYESICKLADLCNQTIDIVNQLNDNVDDLNSRVVNLNSRVQTLENEIATFEAKINAQVDAKLAEVDKKLAEIDGKVNDAIEQLDNAVSALKIYVEREVKALEKELTELINAELANIQKRLDIFEYNTQIYIKAELKKIIDSIPEITSVIVVNPVTGSQTPIQQAVDDLFMNTRYNALTLDEVRHLHLTINECNSLMAHSIPRGWTIIEWLTHAKDWFNKSPKHLMFDPMNGKIKYYKKIVELNTDLHRVGGCLNMTEIGALNMTIEAFNNLGVDCYNLAWRSNRVLV